MGEADFPPCPRRQRLVMFAADGSKDHVFRCTDQNAPMANKDIEVDDCLACPLRQKLLEGAYVPPTRKITDETKPDKGGDGFVQCYLRGVATAKACCGATRQVRVCLNDLCHYYQGEVNPSICAQCPVRSHGAN